MGEFAQPAARPFPLQNSHKRRVPGDSEAGWQGRAVWHTPCNRERRKREDKKFKRSASHVHPKKELDQHPQERQEGQRCEGRSDRIRPDRKRGEGNAAFRGGLQARPRRRRQQARTLAPPPRYQLTSANSFFGKAPRFSGPFPLLPELFTRACAPHLS